MLSCQYGPKFLRNASNTVKVVLKAKVAPTFQLNGGPDKMSDKCGHTFGFKTYYLEAQQLCSFTFIIHEEN